MIPIPLIEAITASVIVGIASCVQGSVGFGMAMIAAPLLMLIEPDLIPAPILISGLALTSLLTYRERKFINIRAVKWTTLGCIPGCIAAAGILTVISSSGFNVLFSILVLFAVALSVFGFSVRQTQRNMLTAGVLTGFMGTTSSIGGPPVAMLYQDMPGAELRGTLSAFFFGCGLIALISLASVGHCGFTELKLALCLLPGVLIGLTVSRFTARRIDRYSMRPSVLILCTIAAIAVLIRNFL